MFNLFFSLFCIVFDAFFYLIVLYYFLAKRRHTNKIKQKKNAVVCFKKMSFRVGVGNVFQSTGRIRKN